MTIPANNDDGALGTCPDGLVPLPDPGCYEMSNPSDMKDEVSLSDCDATGRKLSPGSDFGVESPV